MLLLAYKIFLGNKNYEKILRSRFNSILLYKILKHSNIVVYNLLKNFIKEQKIYFSLRSVFIKSRDVVTKNMLMIKTGCIQLLKIYINVQ